MRFALVESILTPGGHEIEYDRLLIDGLRKLGHEVTFYVPEGYDFKYQYGIPVRYLPGEGVSYAGASRIGKVWLAAKREINRFRWYQSLYHSARKGEFDAVVFPSATYRYLRALHFHPLKESPTPILYIIHGVTPKEAPKFFNQVEKLAACNQIKIVVQTFADNVFGAVFPNLFCMKPPAYLPENAPNSENSSISSDRCGKPIQLGFFGQYRKEKNLDGFLDVFLKCKFTEAVELIVQGATMRQADADDFRRIMDKYSRSANIRFWHKALVGKEWQQAIAAVDALVLPYSAPRYRYQSSAMLSTAIGFYKPVVITAEMNPEVLAEYDIGVCFDAAEEKGLKRALETFVNTYPQKRERYRCELERANDAFSPLRLAERLCELAAKR